MRRICKKICTVFVMTVVAFQSVSAADAAVYGECGLQSRTTSVSQDGSISSEWSSVINSAVSSWNSSGAGVQISRISSANNVFYVDSYSDSWYGICNMTYNSSSGYIFSSNIKLNEKTIREDATDFKKFAQSTTAHEIGHLFWLDDNPVSSAAGNNMSLMNHGRDRNRICTPQTFDITNVKNKYSQLETKSLLSDFSEGEMVNYISVDEPEHDKATDLIKASDILVTGTVKSTEEKMIKTGKQKEELPYTVYEIEIKDTYKGTCEDTIYVKRLGGKIDRINNILCNASEINEGDSYLFAIKSYGSGEYGFVNTTQSSFALKESPFRRYGKINRSEILKIADTGDVKTINVDEKVYPTKKALQNASDKIIVGKAIDYSYKMEQGTVYTIWKVQVENVLKGTETSDIISIKVLGGKENECISLVKNMTPIECGTLYTFYIKDYGKSEYGLTNYAAGVEKSSKTVIVD